jgi:HK97 family phage major capsid protein
MDELKQLQEQRLALAAKMKELGNRQESWNAEDRATWDTLNTDYDAVMAKIKTANDKIEQQTAINNRLAEVESYRPHNSRIGRDGGTIAAGPVNRAAFSPADLNGIHAPAGENLTYALAGWLMNGSHLAFNLTDQHRNAAQALGQSLNSPVFSFSLNQDWQQTRRNAYEFRNALSGIDGTAGGYTKDQTLINNLELAMLAWGGMMQIAEIIRTATGEPLRWPTATDTSNTGRQVGENASHDSGTDPTFGAVEWNAYTFTSDIVKVPNELMTDSVFNLATVLGRMLGERLGRIQNTKYTTGTGAGTAKGITICAGAGVTAASQTAIAFDELIDLEHSLDPSRRAMPGVGYMFHDTILKALRKLKDGESRYLWQAGANSGAPDTLNTYPYTINQDMASSIATGATTVLFGELSAYKIRQVGQIILRRLDERFADTNQTGFLAFVRGDGNLLDAGDRPVKKLVQA